MKTAQKQLQGSPSEIQIGALLNEFQVANILGVSVASLRRWRLLDRGPRYLKVETSLVRYSPESVKAYLDSRPTGGGKHEES